MRGDAHVRFGGGGRQTGKDQGGRPLSDTIVIEAAQIGKNMAPGLNKKFVSEEWPIFPEGFWEAAREKAKSEENDLQFRVIGSDNDARSLKQALINARQAGVEDYVAFQRLELSQVKSSRKYGVIVTNPPYGERMGQIKKLRPLYVEMGKVFRSLPMWSYFIITAYPNFQKVFGEKATKNRKLFNSTIKTYFYEYFGPLPPRKKKRTEEENE